MINAARTTLLLGIMCFTGNCQSPPSSTAQTPQATATTSGAPTPAAAKALLSDYLQRQPQAALYQLDSMQILEVSMYWQMLVPRTDWAERAPNAAAFKGDKQGGRIMMRPLK